MSLSQSKLVRIDNVGIVVEDLDTVVDFFVELGMELEGETAVEGKWVDRVIGLDDAKSDIAMLRTPDGRGRLELSQFHKPKAIGGVAGTPVNTVGKHRVMFTVTDIEEVVGRLKKKFGAELVGEIVRYQDIYKLCYLKGPEGIIVALAEEIGG